MELTKGCGPSHADVAPLKGLLRSAQEQSATASLSRGFDTYDSSGQDGAIDLDGIPVGNYLLPDNVGDPDRP